MYSVKDLVLRVNRILLRWNLFLFIPCFLEDYFIHILIQLKYEGGFFLQRTFVILDCFYYNFDGSNEMIFWFDKCCLQLFQYLKFLKLDVLAQTTDPLIYVLFPMSDSLFYVIIK